MSDLYHRTRLLVGDAGVKRLQCASVAVIGLGGVGSYATEAIARAGVGRLLLVDADTVDITNVNRQLYALQDTIGQKKIAVAQQRIRQINPDIVVDARHLFVDASTLNTLELNQNWHVIDAIDTLPSKVALLKYLHEHHIPCVASMGAARRCDPSRVQLADIAQTRGCPLARMVRRQLRQHRILSGIPCVFSDEPPRPAIQNIPYETSSGKVPVGSIAHLPGLFGLTASGYVINSIVQDEDDA